MKEDPDMEIEPVSSQDQNQGGQVNEDEQTLFLISDQSDPIRQNETMKNEVNDVKVDPVMPVKKKKKRRVIQDKQKSRSVPTNPARWNETIKKEVSNVEEPLVSPMKKNKKGQLIHKRERLLFVSLYQDLKKERPEISKKEAIAILSKQTGFGVLSVRKTLVEYEKTGKVSSPNNKKHRLTWNQKVDEVHRNAIRRKVHDFYMNRELPTLRKVLQAVNNDENLPNFKRTNFWKLLKELNFTYVRRHRDSVLMERHDLILWRRKYLKAMRKFREEGRPIYYLDENWVSSGDVFDNVSIKSEDDRFPGGLSTSLSNPTGNGKRLVVLHIGSIAGFVPGGLLYFEAKKTSVDYHDEISNLKFLEWFEKILPSLEDNAVIVMDDAPYHSVKLEKIPNASWKKIEIIKWLESKGKTADMTMLKAELLQIVSLTNDNFKIYKIDENLSKDNNKTVLRLPPYHCELNPMEMIWSMVKGHIQSHNYTFQIEDVKMLLEQGVEHVTAEHWCDCVRHVMEEEKRFWELDEIADKMIDEIPQIRRHFSGESDSDLEYSD